MGLLTYLVQTEIRGAKQEVEGRTLGRPALATSDGANLTWCVDVDIGATGYDPVSGDRITAPLKNVPIASGVHELTYADAGAPVLLRRSASGRYEVVGFSKRMPGTFYRFAVTIPRPDIGPIAWSREDAASVGYSARALTLAELATLGGGFGTCPLGAVGYFLGDTLVEVRA